MNKGLIKKIEAFAKQEMDKYPGDHDWAHINRVRAHALKIAQAEGGDLEVVELAALLHDVADEKLIADNIQGYEFIDQALGDEIETIKKQGILDIIKNLSWSKGVKEISPRWNHEFWLVQDADRLDALGAIGIARTFSYGGSKGWPLYNPDADLLNTNFDYGMQHIHQKYLKIKDSLHFESSRKIAEPLDKFVREFSEQFLKEWNNTG